MSRFKAGLVAFAFCFWWASQLVQACQGPGNAESILFGAETNAPAEAEVVAEVVLAGIAGDYPAMAMATVGRVLKASDPRVRPGEKIEVIYAISTCGSVNRNGDEGLLMANLATGSDGRLILCPYTRRPRDGQSWPPRAVGDCRPEEVAETDKIRIAAERGEPKAQYRLGQRYEHGSGVRPNYPQALKWYCASAEGGEPWARDWFRQLEGREDAVAQELFRAAVESEEPGVREWFRSAVESGSAKAQYELGAKYRREKNDLEAVKWFKLAAGQGNARAMTGLGRIYRYGGGGLEPNVTEAVKWLALAAAQGSQEARDELKNMNR